MSLYALECRSSPLPLRYSPQLLPPLPSSHPLPQPLRRRQPFCPRHCQRWRKLHRSCPTLSQPPKRTRRWSFAAIRPSICPMANREGRSMSLASVGRGMLFSRQATFRHSCRPTIACRGATSTQLPSFPRHHLLSAPDFAVTSASLKTLPGISSSGICSIASRASRVARPMACVLPSTEVPALSLPATHD